MLPTWIKLFIDGTVEGGTGYVEPLYPATTGKYADFILVDKDVLSYPVMQIHTARTAATFFEGRKVFGTVPGE